MRFVPVKSPAEPSVLVLHRMRTGFVEKRNALVNRLRGLLGASLGTMVRINTIAAAEPKASLTPG